MLCECAECVCARHDLTSLVQESLNQVGSQALEYPALVTLGRRFLALRANLDDALVHRLTSAWQRDIARFLAEGTARTRRALLPMAPAGFESAMGSDTTTPTLVAPVAPIAPVAPVAPITTVAPVAPVAPVSTSPTVPVARAPGVRPTFLVNPRATPVVPPFPPAAAAILARARSSDSAAVSSDPGQLQEGTIRRSRTGTPEDEPVTPRAPVDKGKKRARSETPGSTSSFEVPPPNPNQTQAERKKFLDVLRRAHDAIPKPSDTVLLGDQRVSTSCCTGLSC